MRKFFAVIILSAAVGIALPSSLEQATQHYQHADYKGTVAALAGADEADAAVWALRGKAHYQQGDYGAAVQALEQAVAAKPTNARYWDWLGKAYGRRAESGSFFKAMGRAKKCVHAFERAVEIDGDNLEGLVDLFQYYLNAPGFLGGGVDKAEALLGRIGELNQAEKEFALAELAKKKKEYAAAEAHLRKAISLEADEVGRVLDLAQFLAERKRFDESDRLFAEAEARAAGAPKVLYARAEAYIKAGRKIAEARALLSRYLASPLTPDDPPRHEAQRLLKKAKGD